MDDRHDAFVRALPVECSYGVGDRMLIRIGVAGERFARHYHLPESIEIEHIADPPEESLFGQASDALKFSQTALTVGTGLAAWLFGEPGNIPALAAAAGTGPVYLYFDHASAGGSDAHKARLTRLAALPWELLHNSTGGYIARDLNRGVFRIHALPSPGVAPLPGPAWPLRVVAASGHDDAGGEKTGTKLAAELQALREIFVPWGRSVNLDIIERATNAQLIATIVADPPTVLHFAGHGRHLEGLPPSLVTVGPEGGGAAFSINQIGELRRPPINLVVLNACQSAIPEGEAPTAIWHRSLSHMFLENGARATIAMQADIVGEPATAFVRTLYLECLKGLPLEASVTKARLALDVDRPLWAIPTLTLATVPSPEGFPLFERSRIVKTCVPVEAPDHHSTRYTANYHAQRRALFNWVSASASNAAPKGPVTLLTGEARSGKSHILRWILSSVAHIDQHIRYIDFAAFRQESPTLIDLLRAVRDGSGARDSDGSIQCEEGLRIPLGPAGAFDGFNLALNTYLPGGAATAAIGPVEDRYLSGNSSTVAPVGTRTFDEHVAGRFHEALRACAATKPLFIAIDIGSPQVKFVEGDLAIFLELVVIPELERWRLNRTEAPAIRFAFCCRADTRARYLSPLDRWFANAPGFYEGPPEIRFDAKPSAEELARHFDEMLWYKYPEDVSSLSSVLFRHAQPGQVDIGLCAKLTRMAQSSDLWTAITDPSHGIGDMK